MENKSIGINNIGVEVYKDVASPAMSEIGTVVGRSVKALLAPVRGFLWCWEKIEATIEDGLTKRFANIPEERLKSPDPEIAVPLIQALTYTAQNETLRDMYLALLANSMDKQKTNIVHPSYVEIIKRMNRLDALVFEELCKQRGYQMIINPQISIKGTSKCYSKALPDWYTGWKIEGYNEFDLSASIVRLSKLGIIDLLHDRQIAGADYSKIINNIFINDILVAYQAIHPEQNLCIEATDSVVYVNEYGQQFREACT